MLARHTFSRLGCGRIHHAHSHSFSSSHSSRNSSSKLPRSKALTDELGLPLSPTWSVHELINSYPYPALSDADLTRLHDLAALIPPKEETTEFKQLKEEMEDLVRLVEAVRVAPLETHDWNVPPDGRVWAAGRGVALGPMRGQVTRDESPSGPELLKHAQRTQNGFYLVDSARKKV